MPIELLNYLAMMKAFLIKILINISMIINILIIALDIHNLEKNLLFYKKLL